MHPDDHDSDRHTSYDSDAGDDDTDAPGGSALVWIGVLAILVILGFLYTVMGR